MMMNVVCTTGLEISHKPDGNILWVNSYTTEHKTIKEENRFLEIAYQ